MNGNTSPQLTTTDHAVGQAPAAASTSYRAVLGSRHVARLLGGTLIGRMPNGMAPVAIVLLITSQGASLASAGLTGWLVHSPSRSKAA